MRITLNGRDITFLQNPSIVSSTSGGQMSFTTDEVIIPQYASVIAYDSKDERLFTGLTKSWSTSSKLPRIITVNCVDYSWLLQGKLLTGEYSGKFEDITNQLIVTAGVEEIFGYPSIADTAQLNLNLGDSGVYLQEALSKLCNTIGIYFGVSTKFGVLKFYSLGELLPTNITLPISNCNHDPHKVNYSLTYPEINRVIVKGKGGVLSDFSLSNRNESLSYEIGILDPQRHYSFLREATKVVKAEVTERAITPSFSLELLPEEISVKSGTREQAIYTVQSTSVGGFTGVISLTASFYPLEAGMEIILGSNTLSVGSNTTLTAKLKDEFPGITWGGGQEEITIIGTIGPTSLSDTSLLKIIP